MSLPFGSPPRRRRPVMENGQRLPHSSAHHSDYPTLREPYAAPHTYHRYNHAGEQVPPALPPLVGRPSGSAQFSPSHLTGAPMQGAHLPHAPTYPQNGHRDHSPSSYRPVYSPPYGVAPSGPARLPAPEPFPPPAHPHVGPGPGHVSAAAAPSLRTFPVQRNSAFGGAPPHPPHLAAPAQPLAAAGAPGEPPLRYRGPGGVAGSRYDPSFGGLPGAEARYYGEPAPGRRPPAAGLMRHGGGGGGLGYAEAPREGLPPREYAPRGYELPARPAEGRVLPEGALGPAGAGVGEGSGRRSYWDTVLVRKDTKEVAGPAGSSMAFQRYGQEAREGERRSVGTRERGLRGEYAPQMLEGSEGGERQVERPRGKVRSLDDEPKFMCPHCAKPFGLKGNLKQHVLTVHQRYRPFSCTWDSCPMTFSTRFGLRQHVLTVHERQRPYECPICGATFGQRSHQRRHFRVVHKQDASKENV